jgi:hypothetical protein
MLILLILVWAPDHPRGYQRNMKQRAVVGKMFGKLWQEKLVAAVVVLRKRIELANVVIVMGEVREAVGQNLEQVNVIDPEFVAILLGKRLPRRVCAA